MLFKLNDTPTAIEELRQALRLNPYLPEAHAVLAQALKKAGQADEAQKELAELEKISLQQANNGRAMLLVETGRTTPRSAKS